MADIDGNQELAIKLTDIKKMYKLGRIGGGTLQADLQSWWAKKRGREDPNTRIGTERLIGKTFMALNGIDLEVYKGETLGIIGGNGAGKSTMLKLLSRVTAPTFGKIQIWGRVASMLEVGTGFHREMTGRENVYMNGAILGMTRTEIDEKIEDIIEFSEIREFIDTPVKRYSSGMYVKLAFSVIAHLDSEIMIMDEVLAVGDMAFQRKCLDKMRDAAKEEGRTVLYVSHNMNTIRQLCDRCIVMDEGKIVYNGGVEEAISVYMKSNVDARTSYDYDALRRFPVNGRAVYMSGLDILDRAQNQVACGDALRFVLHCTASKAVSNLKIRFKIFYADGVVVGSVFSDKTISAEKTGALDVTVRLPVKNLAPGKYYCAAFIYDFDGRGNQTVVDKVEPALTFEVTAGKDQELIWYHRWWGHVKFDDMMIEDVKEI